MSDVAVRTSASTAASDAAGLPFSELVSSFAEMVRGIPADALAASSPCSEFTAADLLGHLAGTLASSERAAHKQPQVAEAGAAEPAAVADAALAVAAAWREPGALDGTTEFGPGEMPTRFAATITLQEIAVHGWDLARATGRPFALSAGAGRDVLAAVEQIAEQARATGGYGPEVTPAAGATDFERALAVTGRDAAWSA